MGDIIQSFYSQNCSNYKMFLYNSYYLLSALYAYESDIDITLYTDYEFKVLLEKSPYKNIKEFFKYKNEFADVDTQFFTWPKLVALDAVSRDTIHIDGDVFLKDNSCLRLLDIGNYDVMCQHLEVMGKTLETDYVYNDSFNTIKHLNFPSFIEKKVPKCMPNTGVLCVQNENLWNEYRDTYWNMVKQARDNGLNPTGCSIPDIILEQQFLKEICDYRGYSMKYILDGSHYDEINKNAINNAYQHVCADMKNVFLTKCLYLIKEKNKNCYEVLKSNWKNEFPEYFDDETT